MTGFTEREKIIHDAWKVGQPPVLRLVKVYGEKQDKDINATGGSGNETGKSDNQKL